MGLKIKPVEPDGNCFFRSVADQVEGFETFHDKVRQKVVDYMEAHEDDLKFYVDDEKFKEHCVDMRKQGSWADHLEIHAFAQAYKCDVCVYHANQPVFQIKCQKKAERVVHLAYEGDLHYDSIRRQDDKLWGVPKPIQFNNNQPSGNNSESNSESSDNGTTSDEEKLSKTTSNKSSQLESQTEVTVSEQQQSEFLNSGLMHHTQLGSESQITESNSNIQDSYQNGMSDYSDADASQSHGNSQKHIARNKACPCGSNKKNKDCCANKLVQQQKSAKQEGYLNSGVANAQQQLKVISI